MKLLFIPAAGATKESWFFQTSYFKDSEGVDLPGHPEGKPCTNVDDYVEWLHDYISTRGFKEVVLAGLSLGGAITLLYGLKYPDDLKAIILIGTGARLRVHPSYLEQLKKAVEDKENWVKESLDTTNTPFPPEISAAITKKKVKMGPEVVLNDMLCCDTFDIMDKVHQIKIPTLIINGTEDVMTFVKYAQYLHDKIEGSQLVIIEEAGHGVAMQKPKEVNAAIESFLQSL
ncbi:MAG: alpha/beta hydrolase [Thermodesulfobacteriota bacterium]|nr:alpha/beta hydrolase [Thermodesulfobacteriota bacterium]